MWYLGLLINETPSAVSGRMVCTLDALLLYGFWVFLSMKHRF